MASRCLAALISPPIPACATTAPLTEHSTPVLETMVPCVVTMAISSSCPAGAISPSVMTDRNARSSGTAQPKSRNSLFCKMAPHHPRCRIHERTGPMAILPTPTVLLSPGSRTAPIFPFCRARMAQLRMFCSRSTGAWTRIRRWAASLRVATTRPARRLRHFWATSKCNL